MLPTLADLKAYIRQTDSTAEDALLQQLLARALGAVLGQLDRPISAVRETYVIEDPRAAARSLRSGLQCERLGAVRTMRIPVSPCYATGAQAPVLTDKDGVEIDAADYRVDARTGVITDATGSGFNAFPYTVEATVGLETRGDYQTVVEPALSGVIIDRAADWYQRRNPNAAAEGAGGGVYTQYAQGELGLSPRERDILEPFRRKTL
jgi:hypothetical protein